MRADSVAATADWLAAFEMAFQASFDRRVSRLLRDWHWTLEAGVPAIRAENRRSRRVTRLVLPRRWFLLDPDEAADGAAQKLYRMLREPLGPVSIAFY